MAKRWLLTLAALATCSGCSGASPASRFPDGFLFGVSSSGFSAEMGCPTLPTWLCTDANSDWYQFATSPETIASGGAYLSGEDPAVVGPGFWEMYQHDFDLLETELLGNAFKMTIEWSRIFPRPTDSIEGFSALRAAADPRAVQHYHNVLSDLRRRGMTPLVVLNHYTLPAWLHDAVGCHLDLSACSPKGWVEKDRVINEIGKYAAYAAQEFGGFVDLWCTVQSPFQAVLSAYVWPAREKSNPPAVLLKSGEARTALVGLAEAHARMYDAILAHDLQDADWDGKAAQVGVAYVLSPTRAANPDDRYDRRGAENIFYLWNRAFLEAVARGMLDFDLDGQGEYREDLEGRLDFIGISYFTGIVIDGTQFPIAESFSPLTTFDPFTFIQENAPKGIYEMAMMIEREYRLPIYVVENGTPDWHDDGRASEYMVQHLTWLLRALRDGADVRGYFYNSLTDTFEWNLGTVLKYGLYRVDGDDPAKQRTPRRGVQTYRAIASQGRIPEELLLRYPVEE